MLALLALALLLLFPLSCGDENEALLLLLMMLFAFPKRPSGWVNRASSNSNFRSRLGGGGDVETPRPLSLLLFAIGGAAPGTDDAEVLIVVAIRCLPTTRILQLPLL